jgi:UDPglucose 6-dehydrogenase
MNVCVLGLWHLGAVTAACLASLGHRVSGLDADETVVQKLNSGAAPISEPGLDELIRKGISRSHLKFHTDASEAVRNVEILWVTYDTPVNGNDVADVDYVVNGVESVIPFLPVGSTILISSQVPVGTVRRLDAMAGNRYADKKLSFACSPENLRLGNAVEVFLRPERVVVGVRSDPDRAKLYRLFRSITERIEWMTVESAEMTKHAINAFLAVSVTFANEIASICESVGADAKEVERGMRTENRIGPRAYLSPGAAFSGGTLARDIAFLESIGTTARLRTPLLSSVKESNDEHKLWPRRKLHALFADLSRTIIAVWGLTYKPHTNSLRRSLSVELCDWLLAQGATVHVHDPAVQQLPDEWKAKVLHAADPLVALAGAQALVVATEWPQYREISLDAFAAASPGLVILDANRFLAHLADLAGARYLSVGMASEVR